MTAIIALQIDTREADWLLRWASTPPALLRDVPILNMQLDTGDAKVYCVDGVVLNVERKTPSDFLSSIPNDHIFDQCARMMQERQESGTLPFLVITGEIFRNQQTGGCIIPGTRHGEGWNWHSVQGALLSIQEIGVPVIFCAGDDDYAPCLERLAKRNHQRMIINPTREVLAIDPQEKVLCAFDGIGPELAGSILARCVTLADAIVYMCDMSPTSPKIQGISTGRKTNFRNTLQLTENETLDRKLT